MCFLDFRHDPSSERFRDLPEGDRERWAKVDLSGSYADRDLDAAFRKVCAGASIWSDPQGDGCDGVGRGHGQTLFPCFQLYCELFSVMSTHQAVLCAIQCPRCIHVGHL